MTKEKNHFMVSASGEPFVTNNPEWHSDSKEVTKKEYEPIRINYLRSQLLKMIKPKQVIYTSVYSVSSSGMSRTIKLFCIYKNELRNITSMAAGLCGFKLNNDNMIVRHGCGMDMCYDTVGSLGAALWPKGTKKPHGTRNGEPDSDGYYALQNHQI